MNIIPFFPAVKRMRLLPLVLSISCLYALSSPADISAAVVTSGDGDQVTDQIAAGVKKLFLEMYTELGEMNILPIPDSYLSSQSNSRLLLADATLIPSLDETTLFTADGIASFQTADPADAALESTDSTDNIYG